MCEIREFWDLDKYNENNVVVIIGDQPEHCAEYESTVAIGIKIISYIIET